jgi:DNA-binding response OmpR family regulator
VRTILLVEDDDAIRGCLLEGLRIAGFDVIAVQTTTQALRELEARRHFDLALIDVKMPPDHPHGFAFGRMVRLERPDLPLVFMSGEAGIAEADIGVPLGPMLQKPVRIKELVGVLDAKLFTAG